MMINNTVVEHVPIKLENFNDDDYSSNSNDCSPVWGGSSSTTSTDESSVSLSRTSSITTTMTVNLELDDVVESCGNVFIYSRRKLFLICGFCDSKYANMLQFAKHLNDCHKIFYTNYEETSHLPANSPPTDDSDSDATTTASSLSASASIGTGLIVKGGFQIRFIGEGSSAESDDKSLPTPSDVLLRHVPIKVENEQVLEDEKAMLDFESNIESCGNIFVMNRRKLFLICGFCEGKHANMELLASHLHECHTIFEEDDKANQSISIPPQNVEIKEEPEEVLVAVMRQPTTSENSIPMVAIPTNGNEDIITPEVSETVPAVTSKKKVLRDLRNQQESSKDQLPGGSLPENTDEYFVRGLNSGLHSCRKCPKQFKKFSRMLEHVRVHTGERPFKCLECDKTFRIKLRLTEHQMRHREVKAFKCDICGLGCATRQDFAQHQRHHKGDKRFVCKECGKAFVRSGDLKTHLRIHSDERPFKCEICNSAFRANQNLIIHRRMHEDNKEFKCDFCDKRFRRKIDRKVHHRSHTGEKAFKCEICNRGYSAKVHVRSHIQKSHMNQYQTQDESQAGDNCQTKVNKPSKKNKSFKCTICSKGYSAKYTLEQHIKKVHATIEATTDQYDASKSTENIGITSEIVVNSLSSNSQQDV